MRTVRSLLLLTCVLVMSGCYATSIDTGLQPSNKVIRKPFAACWLYGLVPPKTLGTMAECPNGVARVETQLSFLDQVISGITWGIFTPVQIVVTCAEGPRSSLTDSQPDLKLAKNSSPEDVRDVFQKAADEAVKSKHAVYVLLDQ